jgi:hypothetical protein
MRKGKIRLFRIELATCLLVPVAVLLLIALVGYGTVVREKAKALRPAGLLEEVPLLESRLAAAHKALGGFRALNGGKENGEWSHRVSQAALLKGSTVTSVNVEKISPPAILSCNDYHIQVSGEGRMGAVLGWVDELDQPARCFRVAMLKIRPAKSASSSVYELEMVINARTIAMHSQPGQEWTGPFEPGLAKLNALTVAVNELAKTKWCELDTHVVDAREVRVSEGKVATPVVGPLVLKLTGIVRDGRTPLALTDLGVFGEGEAIDGAKVLHVGVDHIVIVDREGREKVFKLYKNEVTR